MHIHTHIYIYLRITYTYTYTNTYTYIYMHTYIIIYIYITVYDMCSWVYKPTFTLIVVTQCAVARWVRRPKSRWSWWPTQALAPSPPAWPRREGLMAGFTMVFFCMKNGKQMGMTWSNKWWSHGIVMFFLNVFKCSFLNAFSWDNQW